MADAEVSSTNTEVVGTMTCGMLCARMHGHVKVDDNDKGVKVRMHESCGDGEV